MMLFKRQKLRKLRNFAEISLKQLTYSTTNLGCCFPYSGNSANILKLNLVHIAAHAIFWEANYMYL